MRPAKFCRARNTLCCSSVPCPLQQKGISRHERASRQGNQCRPACRPSSPRVHCNDPCRPGPSSGPPCVFGSGSSQQPCSHSRLCSHFQALWWFAIRLTTLKSNPARLKDSGAGLHLNHLLSSHGAGVAAAAYAGAPSTNVPVPAATTGFAGTLSGPLSFIRCPRLSMLPVPVCLQDP